MTDESGKHLSAQALSEYLGISIRHINRIALILKQVERGKFDLKTSVRAYCDYIREQVKYGGSPALIEQRTRLAKTNADRREFEFDVLRTKYVHAETTLHYLTGITIAIKNRVMAVAQKVAPQVAGLTAPEVFILVERYLADALEQVSKLTEIECLEYAKQAEDQTEESKPKKSKAARRMSVKGKKKKDGHGKKKV
jgi:phage terminase Nu1 subunit (DNA packaging protein)